MKMNTIRNAFILSTIMALTGQSAFAQSEPPRAGTVDLVAGKVSVSNIAGVASQPVKGTIISPGDTIETDASGELHVKMDDGGYLAIRPNTVFRIERYVANGDSSDTVAFSLLRGALRSLTGWIGQLNPRGYRLTTPTATIGIRGTDHETVHIPEEAAKPGEMPGTHDRVNNGATFLETAQGKLEIAEGHAGYVSTAAGDASRGKPILHASIPKFLIERRTSNDTVADRYYSEIGVHIRRKLQERKKPAATDKNDDSAHPRQMQAKEQRMSSGQNEQDRPKHAPKKRKP